ncbi:MAG: pseudouridine synthase [Candidatus Omnitrophota bacterium]
MEKRLQNILAHAGVASRRRAAQMVEEGRVSVDGKVVAEKGLRLDPARHEILVDGKAVAKEEKKYYFLFNKPKGVISTAIDTHGREKVTDYFKGINVRLYPVGRLDKDTTGLLILTNDGDLAHRLSHPSFEVSKEYVATVSGMVVEKEAAEMERGVLIDGERTAPCEIKFVRRDDKYSVLRIRIHEGRKRQIRRMFESLGKKVRELERVKYAFLTLGSMKPGESRELSEKEVNMLKKIKRSR